ncbi:WYL domain-containing protein [Actinomadura craniellae]|uniref:WYL domain-containing protein n=1 Tax=Actinomadura craniellae TaxID=2231787 RepID=A0A365H2Q6_9ACTN|nr:WYL domain-containing protein [Actinomadura craniellae]RAY12503.1 WYL domain-containing protein [Actinomadura craniellae]
MANVVTSSSRTQPSLTPAEIAALALSLAHLGTGPQATVARRAIRHLIDEVHPADAVIADTLSTLTEPLDGTTADRARVIAAAITDRMVVRLHYRDAGARTTVREVEPVTCLVHGDHWYLVAWCRLRSGVRAFRFDRIAAVESTTVPASPHRADHYLPWQRAA